jgi:hypothetical protein
MKEFNIKISGSGTTKEIISALRDVIDGIISAKGTGDEAAILDGAVWEDATLVTEIKIN